MEPNTTKLCDHFLINTPCLSSLDPFPPGLPRPRGPWARRWSTTRSPRTCTAPSGSPGLTTSATTGGPPTPRGGHGFPVPPPRIFPIINYFNFSWLLLSSNCLFIECLFRTIFKPPNIVSQVRDPGFAHILDQRGYYGGGGELLFFFLVTERLIVSPHLRTSRLLLCHWAIR